MKIYLVLITGVNILDTWATVWLANLIGWEYEGNRALAWYFQRLGVWPASVLKISGALVLAAVLWEFCERARARWVRWVFLLGFAFVAVFNTAGVIVLWPLLSR